ncbi:hypothetical protein BC629DRAFT_1593360 [Irpex lacteus]|nr:hypothetical protein BC629DRAFT_1593360 [Irpex lacteus]
MSADCVGTADLLSLDSCSNLRRLCIQVFPAEHWFPTLHRWELASKLFSAVLTTVPQTVQSLTIMLQFSNYSIEDHNMIDWEAINDLGGDASGKRRLSCLSELTFAGRLEVDEQGYIALHLPSWNNRGILKFSDTVFWTTHLGTKYPDVLQRNAQRNPNSTANNTGTTVRMAPRAWGASVADRRHHTFMDYVGHTPIPGMVVPQQVYRTDAVFQSCAPVQFFHHGQFGILLPDAIASKVSNLHNAQQELKRGAIHGGKWGLVYLKHTV